MRSVRSGHMIRLGLIELERGTLWREIVGIDAMDGDSCGEDVEQDA